MLLFHRFFIVHSPYWNYLGEKIILRKSDRPRRKLMRVTSLVVPIVGALLALGFMTAPAANAGIADNSTGAMQAESEQLHQEARDATDLANKFDQDNIAINDSAAADLRDAAQKAEAMAQERDQAVQAVEDADSENASRFQ